MSRSSEKLPPEAAATFGHIAQSTRVEPEAVRTALREALRLEPVTIKLPAPPALAPAPLDRSFVIERLRTWLIAWLADRELLSTEKTAQVNALVDALETAPGFELLAHLEQVKIEPPPVRSEEVTLACGLPDLPEEDRRLLSEWLHAAAAAGDPTVRPLLDLLIEASADDEDEEVSAPGPAYSDDSSSTQAKSA